MNIGEEDITFEPENLNEAFELGKALTEHAGGAFLKEHHAPNFIFKIRVSRLRFFEWLGLALK